ncbi:MAG: NifB/NifX family molybdenum-iron cluster-binding protein [Pirellulales bacterium]|nr:NifB/NifX family molybdenum-iron cluster-binding protein [Pirellulales bacterium]
MNLAIPIWQGRVSPVFDVAEQLLLVEMDGDAERSRRTEILPQESAECRARRIAGLGVTTLVCGAVSRPLESLLWAQGIEVLPRVCGDVEDVLQAYRVGALQEERFAMPGCCGRLRRRQRCRYRRGGRRRGDDA